MGDKFKAFLNGEINFPKLTSLVDLKNIALKILHIEGDGNSLVKVDNRKINQIIQVTINVASSEVKDHDLLAQRVGELVQTQVQELKKPVLEVEASKTISELDSPSQYQNQIDFFQAKIPTSDMLILRAAYYLRTLHESGNPVTSLKKGITARYGNRGSSIANLCSGGYFETYLRPLYKMLEEKPNFTDSMFLDNYEIVINNAPFAYFVNGNQNLGELVKSLVDKIMFSKRYGQHKLAIHAIGRENINKVNRALEDESISNLISDDTDTNIRGTVMTVTIHYR